GSVWIETAPATLRRLVGGLSFARGGAMDPKEKREPPSNDPLTEKSEHPAGTAAGAAAAGAAGGAIGAAVAGPGGGMIGVAARALGARLGAGAPRDEGCLGKARGPDRLRPGPEGSLSPASVFRARLHQ